ncbi:MAG: fatty acid desaturase [Planctomycetes bacterium]|nr:fatty acid desaturase [Planctomycetota bacterium]
MSDAPATEPEFHVFETASCRQDQDRARAIARAFEQELRANPAAARRERRAGLQLALEWFALLAVSLGLIYGPLPLLAKALLLVPWALYAALAFDNITHYANHWPLFGVRALDALWRWSGVLVFYHPLEIRAIHNDHHRAYARADNDEKIFGARERGKSFALYLVHGALGGLRSLMPWRAMDASVANLRTKRPDQHREIVLQRWTSALFFAVLAWMSPLETLALYVPAILLMGSLGSLVMNLTDHIPGDAHHPFRLATYLQPSTRAERFYDAVNHHTAATHLSHHLYPNVHWVHLPALQARLAPIYERQAAPRSLLLNSTLLGNPLAFASVLRVLRERRFEGVAP